MAASYADGTISVYSSMLGDPLYHIKDESISYPITALCWKPAGFGGSVIQTFKALGSDGNIF